MGSGKSKSKKMKEPDKFFEREKWKEQQREESKKKNVHPSKKRLGVKTSEQPVPSLPALVPPAAAPPGPRLRSFDDEALERMRYQLRHDADAFLLNNILLSVQFFENYERQVKHLKDNPMDEYDHLVDKKMVKHHKHVFFADRLHECVQEHVSYRRRDKTEALMAPRLFIIYDNVEASEPGDTSDYSAVLDAPFYKLEIEGCKESGYVKLKKLEVLESTLPKENETVPVKSGRRNSDDSIYTDSEKESNDSDSSWGVNKGEILLQRLKARLNNSEQRSINIQKKNLTLHNVQHDVADKSGATAPDLSARRGSGPIKLQSVLLEKSSIANLSKMRVNNEVLLEEEDSEIREENENKPRKSILKNVKKISISKDTQAKVDFNDSMNAAEDTETSGYRSKNESSETESDYGYSTITEITTPKRVELSERNIFLSSGVLPEKCWSLIQARAVDQWTDDEEEIDELKPRQSLSRQLYETHYYLSSMNFMQNFIDNFIMDLGSCLGLTQEAVKNSLTQGASVYCDIFKNGSKVGCEIFPALLAAWPSAANQWIIRERKVIQNPRTNFTYQWPTKYMVNKAIGLGCLLIPIGFRPKRGNNTEQKMQWRITFPAAERYLESCLAHSHIRCFLFALTMHKTFLENESSKVGIDATHLKNHLFWECEDNYAKWPEDRLGESLRIFFKSFYTHFGQSRFPNYFIENCNDFKSIPKPLLMKLQRKLADILEAPVMHVLCAIEKLRYNKKDFYPKLNCHRLYEILTTKNPLRILNPNLPMVFNTNDDSTDSDNEIEGNDLNLWEKAKHQDKNYQWKKERQRQIKERRRAYIYNKKQKGAEQRERTMKENIILPKHLETERRRVVLEFFIPHFIAMARSSERFEAIKQEIIYLEQARRLCVLLLEEPGGDTTANEFMEVIRDKLADCQRLLVQKEGFKLPPRRESYSERPVRPVPLRNPLRKQRPRYEHMINTDSPTDNLGINAFSFVDVHVDAIEKYDAVKFSESISEESKL